MPAEKHPDAMVNRPVSDIPAWADLAIMVAVCLLFWAAFTWVVFGWL